MRLFLDLAKAQQSTGGTSTKKEEQSVVSYNESFAETTSGVSGESAGYDDPKQGKKWSHGEGESLDDELEAKRQKRNKKAQDRNLVPTPEEVGIKKAFDSDAMDMVKSLESNLRVALNLDKYSATEREFLKSVKGYTDADLKKSHILITGRDRALFSQWLCDRINKSLNSMYRR